MTKPRTPVPVQFYYAVVSAHLPLRIIPVTAYRTSAGSYKIDKSLLSPEDKWLPIPTRLGKRVPTDVGLGESKHEAVVLARAKARQDSEDFVAKAKDALKAYEKCTMYLEKER